MFLSAICTLILMAPIHCRGFIGEQVIFLFLCGTYKKIFIADCPSLFFLFIERECYHNFLKATFSVNNDLNVFHFLHQNVWGTTMVAHISFNVLSMVLFVFFLWDFIALRRTAKLPKKKGTKV